MTTNRIAVSPTIRAFLHIRTEDCQISGCDLRVAAAKKS